MDGARRASTAFRLAQVGAAAAQRFAAAVATIDLTPPLAGILRLIATEPGISQQDLARRLGIMPSRVVAHIDALEGRGLVRRTRGTTDRRVYSLTLTEAGTELMRTLGSVARHHDEDVVGALSAEQRRTLDGLLDALADSLDLTPGVHPGYRGAPRSGQSPVS